MSKKASSMPVTIPSGPPTSTGLLQAAIPVLNTRLHKWNTKTRSFCISSVAISKNLSRSIATCFWPKLSLLAFFSQNFSVPLTALGVRVTPLQQMQVNTRNNIEDHYWKHEDHDPRPCKNRDDEEEKPRQDRQTARVIQYQAVRGGSLTLFSKLGAVGEHRKLRRP